LRQAKTAKQSRNQALSAEIAAQKIGAGEGGKERRTKMAEVRETNERKTQLTRRGREGTREGRQVEGMVLVLLVGRMLLV
jgi:hypothetical protein